MGEMRYCTNDGKSVMFSEDNYEYSCLCTFPHNEEVCGKQLGRGTVSSLALLGAAVAIAANKPSSMVKQSIYDNYYYLPECVPEWIRKEIDRNLEVDIGR